MANRLESVQSDQPSNLTAATPHKRGAESAGITPIDDFRRGVEIRQLTQELSELRERVAKLEQQNGGFDLNFPPLTRSDKGPWTRNENHNSQAPRDIVSTVVHEIKDRDSRQKSVIVFGICELREND